MAQLPQHLHHATVPVAALAALGGEAASLDVARTSAGAAGSAKMSEQTVMRPVQAQAAAAATAAAAAAATAGLVLGATGVVAVAAAAGEASQEARARAHEKQGVAVADGV